MPQPLRRLKADLDFNQNEAQLMRFHVLATAPDTPTFPAPQGGQPYYNSVDGQVWVYDGVNDVWRSITNPAETNTFGVVTDGTNTATAGSAGDTFKLRAGTGLSIVVANNDPTHGDSALFTVTQGDIDHGSIGGLSDDDHAQYLLLAGRSGGQVASGGTGSGDSLLLQSTAHSTRGRIFFGSTITSAYDDVNHRLGIGTINPSHPLDVTGVARATTFTATQATGTAPLTVSSTTLVTNLNADMVDGAHASTTPGAGIIPIANGSGKIPAGFITDQLAITDLSDVTAKTGTGTTVVFATSPTIVTPTIASLTNAQHTHQDAAGGGTLDHGLALTGLSDDDHTQYALLAGRGTGQSLIGGLAASNTLTLVSTNHGTKGKIVLGLAGTSAYDEANDRLGIGNNSPTEKLDVTGVARATTFTATQATGTAPLTVSSTTVVSNLNADMVDGFHASATPGANIIPVANGSGKIPSGFYTGQLAITDLSDVTAKTGTGTTVVFATSPTIVTPTIASLTNAQHTHQDAAGGGTLVSAAISDFDTTVRSSRLDQMAAPTAAVTFNGQRITNLADPVNDTDAAHKLYVDQSRAGLSPKDAVRTATTAPITLAAPGASIGGVTLDTNDRVLVKDQADEIENGIYVFNGAASPMTRSSDADDSGELAVGTHVFVEEGTNNFTGWVANSDDSPIIPGTSEIHWVQYSGSAEIVAGDGLTKSGNTLNVVGTADRITAAADTIDIASDYVGQTSITTLGTVATGTWNATTIAINKGGTGATSESAARLNLSDTALPLPQAYVSLVGDGIESSYTITHNLNTRAVAVAVYETGGDHEEVYPGVSRPTTNTVQLEFDDVPAEDEFEVAIIG